MSRARVVVGVVVLLLGLLATGAVPTTSGRLTGKVTNTTDTARSGLYPLGCTVAATRPGAFLVYPFDEAVGLLTATDASGNGRNGGYSLTGVTYRAAGPCPRDGSRAVTLDGATGYVRALNVPAAGPQVFSVQVWFRTSTLRGGKLVGFGTGGTLTDLSTTYDRHVYMTDAGRLVAGVSPGGTQHTATSSASYNDGAWHHLVATLGTVGTATGGLRLYVDGVLVASDTTAPGAQAYSGQWRFGFDNVDGWPGRPTSRYFAGSLAYGAVWPSALTLTQVVELYYAGR